MSDFEIEAADVNSMQEVPTEVLVTLAMSVLEELERRLSVKPTLKSVN